MAITAAVTSEDEEEDEALASVVRMLEPSTTDGMKDGGAAAPMLISINEEAPSTSG